MTEETIKALAETKFPFQDIELAESHSDAEDIAAHNLEQILKREGFIAGYKAALSGTERVECYLPDWNGGGEYTGIPMKKVTLTVVNPSNKQS